MSQGLFNYQNLKDLFGDGIFAVDGDKWRQQRKLASYEFTTKVLRDFSGAVFKSNAAKLAHIISKSVIVNKKMNIQVSFNSIAFHESFQILLLLYNQVEERRDLSLKVLMIYLQDLFMKSTMDSIFKVGFGMDLDCLHDSHDGSIFANAFDDSSELIMLRYVNVFWKIMKLLNIGSEAILKERIKVINDFIYKLIDKRVEQCSNGGNDLVSGYWN